MSLHKDFYNKKNVQMYVTVASLKILLCQTDLNTKQDNIM